MTLETGADSRGIDVDALLLVSFGGPEGPEDVLPFLRNVTRGRSIPDERLAEVATHYDHFGGRSPINSQNRALLAALRERLAPMPVYWGNRNWAPFLTDAVASMRADGVRRAAYFVTAAFASHSGCRQYQQDLTTALHQVGPGAPDFVKLRLFFDHPGFLEPMVDRCVRALEELPATVRGTASLIFIAHSLPLAQARASGPDGGAYERQLRATAAVVADQVQARLGHRHPFRLAYCSRSGPPGAPWLEPDVNDTLAELARAGEKAAVIVPIGFVSDHMEVVYDLDVEAMNTARRHGLTVARAGTVGTDPRFVDMVADLIVERRHPHRERRALTSEGPARDVCPPHCCDPARPTPAGGSPARDSDQPTSAGGAGTRAHSQSGVRPPAAADVPADPCGRSRPTRGMGFRDGEPRGEATILVEDRAGVSPPGTLPAGE